MDKQELEFREIAKALDGEFADYLLDVDYDFIKKEGLGNMNPFSLRRNYWSKPLDETTTNPNANLGNVGENKNFVNQIAEVNAPIEKISCYYLYRRYANKRGFDGDKLIKNVFNGALYIHNSSLFTLPYCISLPTAALLTSQIQFSDIPTLPPKRPASFINLALRLIHHASNCFAGATALTDFFVNYSYFTKITSNYDERMRVNDMQNFVHGVADRIRISGQSPFSNLNILSPETMRVMFESYIWNDSDFKINDLMDEIIYNQMIYLEFLGKGMVGFDKKPLGLPYRFPVTTFVIDPSFEKEYPEEYRRTLVINKDFCFLNFMRNMNTDLTKLSMCCRLSLSMEDMLKLQINNTFGSYLTLGSHAVVTINMARIALDSKGNWDDFKTLLAERMEQVKQLLIVHRNDILGKRRIKYHEFFKNGLLDLNTNFFSTIGFVGLPDAIEYMDENIMDEHGLQHAIDILSMMKELSVKFSVESGNMFNIEEVPAEGASGVLAAKDKYLFPNKAQKSFYSSQFVPLSYDIPIGKRIEVEGKLQNLTTGGSISHINILGEMDEINGFKFQDRLIKNTNLVQYALNKGYTLCKHGHNSMGVFMKCPLCGETEGLDWLTRIVGYYVEVSKWNKMKQLDFKTRQWSSWE